MIQSIGPITLSGAGAEDLAFRSMTFSEGLSTPFACVLSVLSDKPDLDPNRFLGETLTGIHFTEPCSGYRSPAERATRFGGRPIETSSLRRRTQTSSPAKSRSPIAGLGPSLRVRIGTAIRPIAPPSARWIEIPIFARTTKRRKVSFARTRCRRSCRARHARPNPVAIPTSAGSRTSPFGATERLSLVRLSTTMAGEHRGRR